MDVTRGMRMRGAGKIKWWRHQHEQKQYTSRNQNNTFEQRRKKEMKNERNEKKESEKESEKERKRERKKKTKEYAVEPCISCSKLRTGQTPFKRNER